MTRLSSPQRGAVLLTCGAAVCVVLALAGDARIRAHGGGDRDDDRHGDRDDDRDGDAFKAWIGLAISPVELNLRRRNRALVGLGSYIVNAQAGCSDCHTSPQFVAGGDPFLGQPEEINTVVYLGGGRAFGPIISNNITPDPDTGLPAGMTFDEFEDVMRTGIDRDHSFPPVPSPDNDLLQVMPWPVFANMTDRDLRAIYEYLRAIPSVE